MNNRITTLGGRRFLMVLGTTQTIYWDVAG